MQSDDVPKALARLEGWRKIAAYLRRSESTVKRWATDQQLPVYRIRSEVGRKGLPVYAFAHELDQWLAKGASNASTLEPSLTAKTAETVDQPNSNGDAAALPRKPWHRAYLILCLMLLAASVAGLAWRLHQPPPSAAQPSANTPPAQARELYLHGTYLWNRRTAEGIAEAITAFEQALAIAPDYADAHAGLAMAYNLARQYSGMSGFEAYPKAEAAARRAVQLAPRNAFAQGVLAFVEFHWLWEVEQGLGRFEHALQLDPHAANLLMWYASSLLHVERFAESLQVIARAQELDPDNTTILNLKAQALFFIGREEESLSLLRQLIARDPQHPWNHEFKSRILMARGEHDRALDHYARLGDLIGVPRYRTIAETGRAALAAQGVQAMAHAMAAAEADFYARGEALAWDVARYYALANDAPQAFRWLRTSLEQHEERLIGIALNPAIRSLKHFPEYQQLAAAIGLAVPRREGEGLSEIKYLPPSLPQAQAHRR